VVAVILSPRNSNISLNIIFPHVTLGSSVLHFVSEFKYLGHNITNDLHDNNDIQRKIRRMFIRTKTLA